MTVLLKCISTTKSLLNVSKQLQKKMLQVNENILIFIYYIYFDLLYHLLIEKEIVIIITAWPVI